MMIEESCVDNLHEDKTKNEEDSSENIELRNISDDTKPIVVSKKRIIAFSDSDSDVDTEIKNIHNINVSTKTTLTSSSDETYNTTEPIKYESARTENKKKKLRDKFKKLKVPHSQKVILETENDDSNDSGARRDESDDEISCRNIIEEVKKSAFTMQSICDPDTSDEEDKDNSKISSYKKKHKTAKPTSPKPLRISAKQAMENMQKIKSESNRMLREREISLPYHRPKALSLKDIMSRRKLAVSSDGKALPIKMSSDQLKLYATMLEERQKEVIELCKSESEDEIPENDEVTNVYTNDILENKTSEDNSTRENETVTNKEILLDNETYNIEENNILNNKEGQESINCDLEEKSCPNITVNVKQTITSVNPEEKLVIDAETSETSLLQYSTENDIDMDTSNIQQNELPKTSINSITEDESQVMMLHYDSEAHSVLENKNVTKNTSLDQNIDESKVSSEDEFMDNDFNFDEISKIIDEAELNGNETFKETINNTVQANAMPKLTGCPGTFIELDDKGAGPQKLSGVEMLKERYSYFAKLKSLEDMEKDREKKYKPGTQHLKLKQELEQQIAEQRSMEWEKRLEEESKLKAEMTENISDDEIEKIEAKLESETEGRIVDSSESEEEPIENDVILEDKPKKRNLMVDDEAEVSDCDETVDNNEKYENDNNIDDDESMDDESSDSSESEEEPVDDNKPKKGRILKAFEDSDDEACDDITSNKNNENLNLSVEEHKTTQSDIKDSQDDDLQLAQANRSSQDLFSTQESNPNPNVVTLNRNNEGNASSDLGTQTFSIMKSVTVNSSKELMSPDKLLESQSQYLNIESEGLSQNILSTQSLQSQEIGDDIAALCTGKFYDNPFVSQDENIKNTQKSDDMSGIAALCTGKFYDNPFLSQMPNDDTNVKESDKENNRNEAIGDATDKIDTIEKSTLGIEPVTEPNILNSVLDELDGPDVVPKKNKYFFTSSKEDNLKKKFIIDSDDETNDTDTHKRVKKLKKRKAEQRALQISDDEEDELEDEEAESEIEENEDKLVEYDSEENEVEVQQKPLKKKRVGDFFENEAELTSEDEWIGSGDEDERDLDVMEREEGDDETFQQDQLQKELGQIHMREVLDQDKREVRLLQELLFEDGDLGDGHRQRKFRWRNADGEIETGTNPDEFLDTQEDDFESEEQWRKQRHERETFLRQMQEKEEDLNTSINRTTIIKANLNSRSMSTLIAETKTDKIEKITSPDAVQKKNSKDIPSPKKPFTILQQNYHGSLLTRGRGALARLAALATPLATDDDTPKAIGSTNRGNFVFTSINPEEKPKVTKRKAETNVGTPRLIKKMKTDETSKYLKSSLFDHLKT